MIETLDRAGVIIGASGTIGSAIAKRLQRRGARLILTTHDTPLQGFKHVVYGFDIHKKEHRKNLLELVDERFGRCDFLINTYGPLLYKPITNTTQTEMIDNLVSNSILPITLAMEFEQSLKRGRQPTVVLFAFRGVEKPAAKKKIPVYAAAKTALWILAESLQTAWKQNGISIHTIAVPPITNVPNSLKSHSVEPVAKLIEDMVMDGRVVAEFNKSGTLIEVPNEP